MDDIEPPCRHTSHADCIDKALAAERTRLRAAVEKALPKRSSLGTANKMYYESETDQVWNHAREAALRAIERV